MGEAQGSGEKEPVDKSCSHGWTDCWHGPGYDPDWMRCATCRRLTPVLVDDRCGPCNEAGVRL